MIPNLGNSDAERVLGQYDSSGWRLPGLDQLGNGFTNMLGQVGGALNNALGAGGSPAPSGGGIRDRQYGTFGFGSNPNPFASGGAGIGDNPADNTFYAPGTRDSLTGGSNPAPALSGFPASGMGSIPPWAISAANQMRGTLSSSGMPVAGGVVNPSGGGLLDRGADNAGVINPFAAFSNGAQAWADYQAGKYGAGPNTRTWQPGAAAAQGASAVQAPFANGMNPSVSGFPASGVGSIPPWALSAANQVRGAGAPYNPLTSALGQAGGALNALGNGLNTHFGVNLSGGNPFAAPILDRGADNPGGGIPGALPSGGSPGALPSGGGTALGGTGGGLGASGGNPNEPSGLANQYNARALSAQRVAGGGGAGGGYGAGGGGGGGAKPMTQRDFYQQQLDKQFGDGWSAQFTQQNSMDPISFYEREVPAHITDPAERASIAMQRAGNDARWHPSEIADWQQKHGNTPIPPEQWRIWSKINQGGGPDYGAGVGVDPYGVH